MVTGEYYLHENGSLIYKPHGGVDSTSTFVKGVWDASTIGRTPDEFVNWLLQAYKLGANKSEIERLAMHDSLNNYVPNWRNIIFMEN